MGEESASETAVRAWKLTSVVEKTFAAHCSFGWSTLKFHSLNHPVYSPERLRSFLDTDVGRFRLFMCF